MSSSLLQSPPLSPVSSSSSPVYTPARHKVSKRLLIPDFHVPQHHHQLYTRSPRKSTTSTRLSRPRAESGASIASHISAKSLHKQWPFDELHVQVVQRNITLAGYRLYAVEKWLVQRFKISVLIVYTGELNDKIAVAAVTPHHSLSAEEHAREWEKLEGGLRDEGARSRQTEHGTILVTSLATFRSDYTVVHIPNGDFLHYRDQLCANINLLRIGCSGRSALTLSPPSDVTKDRFVNMYHFRDNVRSPDLFIRTVLELITIIQRGLSFFGCYPITSEYHDGLLCDNTVFGIDQWVESVCWPYAKIEVMERIADPCIVASLLSLVLTVRNKLAAVGYSQVPKDPFAHPRQFMRIICAFSNQRANQLRSQDSTGSTSPSQQHQLTTTSPNSTTATQGQPVLNEALLRRIDAVYDKVRSHESYKVHRVLLNKLDDITTTATSAFASSSSKGRAGHGHVPSLSLTSLASAVTGTSAGVDGMMEVTSDLAAFVLKVGLLRGKDGGAPSLRYLWAGRLDQVERVWEEGEWSDAEKERDVLREVGSGERSDERSSEEEGEDVGALPWSGRVHRKIEGWKEYAKAKAKRSSVDISRDKSFQSDDRPRQSNVLPAVIISGEPDDFASPSSGQASPISPSASVIGLVAGVSPHASSTGVDDAEFFRRLQTFNQRYPQPSYVHAVRARARTGSYNGFASWSDPVSMEELVPAGTSALGSGEWNGSYPYGIGYGYTMMHANGSGYGYGDRTARQDRFPRGRGDQRGRDMSTDESGREDVWESRKRARSRHESANRLKRWSSFDDHILRNPSDCLTPPQMQIDVDLCAQCLIMRRRRFHVDAIIKTLQTVLQEAANSNEILKSELESNKEAIQTLEARCAQLSADIDSARYETDAIMLDTNALRYEARGYDVSELWQMARVPRHRVFAIRDRVFGTGFASSSSAASNSGAHHVRGGKAMKGAHGRFNRVQKTLDRKERYVDWLGRTESEVDEESELPEVMPSAMPDAGVSSISLAESETTAASTPGVDAGGAGMSGYVGGYAALGAIPQRLSAGGGGWLLTMFSKWGSVLGVRSGAGVGEGLSSTDGKPSTGNTKVETQDTPAIPVKEVESDMGHSGGIDSDEKRDTEPSSAPGASEERGPVNVGKELPVAAGKLSTILEEKSSDYIRSSTSNIPGNQP